MFERGEKIKNLPLTHLPHTPHDTELLCVDEALQHDPDGHVDVILQHIVPQMHLGMSLRHADHGLNMADCDRNAARGLRTNQHNWKSILFQKLR